MVIVHDFGEDQITAKGLLQGYNDILKAIWTYRRRKAERWKPYTEYSWQEDYRWRREYLSSLYIAYGHFRENPINLGLILKTWYRPLTPIPEFGLRDEFFMGIEQRGLNPDHIKKLYVSEIRKEGEPTFIAYKRNLECSLDIDEKFDVLAEQIPFFRSNGYEIQRIPKYMDIRSMIAISFGDRFDQRAHQEYWEQRGYQTERFKRSIAIYSRKDETNYILFIVIGLRRFQIDMKCFDKFIEEMPASIKDFN